MKIKTVSVFGSSSVTSADLSYQTAYRLGRLLADKGMAVISGGYGGIMEACSRGAREAGGKTMGVTTSHCYKKPNAWISEEITVPSWQERLMKLMELGDAFIVMDGATGTWTELFVAWEMLNRKIFKKPLIVLGEDFKGLLHQLRQKKDFIFPASLHLADTPEQAVDLLAGP
jgi:uncharacterized protein (TIGR00730 family)